MEPQPPNIISHSSEAELPLLHTYHMFDKAHLTMPAQQELLLWVDLPAGQ